MKKIKTLLLTLLIATFLLPFTPPGCNDMRNNKEKTEKNNLETKSIQRDTLVQNKSDSINIITNNQQVPDSSELSSNETSELDSLTIFQRVLIYPDAKNLSGTGYLIHYFVKEYFFVFFAFLIPFLLLLQNIFSVKFIVSHDKYL